jgi:hypothetical protein
LRNGMTVKNPATVPAGIMTIADKPSG